MTPRSDSDRRARRRTQRRLLAQMRSETLRGICEALQRLESGSYGVCSECGGEIPELRLEALPFASLCHRCQSERETTSPRAAPRARRIVFEPRVFQTDEEPTAAQAARRAQHALRSAA